jgi:hypothetical protein
MQLLYGDSFDESLCWPLMINSLPSCPLVMITDHLALIFWQQDLLRISCAKSSSYRERTLLGLATA